MNIWQNESTEKTKCTPNEESKTCAHWVYRKKRNCKMTVANGRKYCGEHEPQVNQETNEVTRIPCPLDGKHTVYMRNIHKHLKICNARQKSEEPAYVDRGINAGEEVETSDDYSTIRLSELSDEEFFDVVKIVKELYATFVDGQIETLRTEHKSLGDELSRTEYGKETKKHLRQTSSLLGILESEQQLQSSTSYIEFGAGKGQLAFFLAQVLKQHEKTHVVLLDRMSLRHKKDNKIEDRTLVQRIRVDIADFRMERLELSTKRKVAISKHLCGAATDLTLRCITRQNGTGNSEAVGTPIDFVLIALCCHHRCDWRSFVGKNFFLAHNLTHRQFVIMTKMVGWAICGTGMSRERRRALAEQEVTPEELVTITENQRLPLEERERVGNMCKRLLDYARIEYLSQHGYAASLKYYVPRDVTLENVCLIACKTKEL